MIAVAVADWALNLSFVDIPDDVVRATRSRILDVVGLALAGGQTPFGIGTREAALTLSPGGPARIWGTDSRAGIGAAALANASCAQALEFDDTHNESIVHMSSPAVAAGLALADTRPVSGRE